MFIELDLAGAEWVVVAYLSRDENMLNVVKSGKSPHVVTGALMTGLPEELVEKDEKLVKHLKDPQEIQAARKANLPEIYQATFLPRTMSIRQAGKKCLSGDTEVLTPRGWQRLDTIKVGQFVMQWEAGALTFAKVKATHVYDNTEPLVHLHNTHLSQIGTPQHKLLLKHTKKHTYEVCTIKTLPTTTKWGLVLSGVFQSNTPSLLTEWETRLLVALQADGFVDSYGSVDFKFSKQRKYERLQHILTQAEIPYTLSPAGLIYIPRCPSLERIVKLLCNFEYSRQERHAVKTPRPRIAAKNFGDYLLQLDTASIKAFADEICHWDGHAKRGQYFTTNAVCAYWVQTMLHLVGKRATIIERPPAKNGFGKKNMFWVKIGKADTTTCSVIKRTMAKADKVYCLTVPSGFFMVRHNGKISITGNSNHSADYRITAPTFSLTQEIDLADAKRIIESYTCQSPMHGQPSHRCGTVAYPRIRDWWDATDAKVKATRTLTNCFGQKVQFMGQLNSDLFKQSYAFVPQSTVVAITNRAMPLILEDESPAFEPLHIVAQIHDSLLIDYISDDMLAMATTVHKIAYDYMRPELNYGEPFKLNVTGKVGMTWGSLKEIALPDNVEGIATNLRKAREGLKASFTP